MLYQYLSINLVYKKNINDINKNITGMNFFTQSIVDIINFLKDDIYKKYATKYINEPQNRVRFIRFMKTNVEEAGDIVKILESGNPISNNITKQLNH